MPDFDSLREEVVCAWNSEDSEIYTADNLIVHKFGQLGEVFIFKIIYLFIRKTELPCSCHR